MRTLTEAEQAELEAHALWLKTEAEQGERIEWTNRDLREADLRCNKMSNAFLVKADLRFADLRDADLPGALLIEADLHCADLSVACLMDANLRCADLSGALLIETSLCCADLRFANLTDACLINADLSGADLRKANLTGAILIGANLEGANFTGVKLASRNSQHPTADDLMAKLGQRFRYNNNFDALIDDSLTTGYRPTMRPDLNQHFQTLADCYDAVMAALGVPFRAYVPERIKGPHTFLPDLARHIEAAKPKAAAYNAQKKQEAAALNDSCLEPAPRAQTAE